MKKDDKKQQDDVVSQATTENAQLDQLGKELTELKEQFELQNSQLKRAVADYQNLEKRVAEGRSELKTWVSAGILTKLLPVLDHLDKALTGASEEEKRSGWFKGVAMAVAQLKNTLKEEGLSEIVADGQFDPSQHEAVDTATGEENTIVEVAEKGYTLNGKVLKPAKVVVGKKGASS
ncbi:nucleotide exchange factor GrpE [Candidatus Daviesbacteria bacterium RIFCSPHIGHO2_01_FULL_44_29]|uniref:Protein GrpE n=1 Tax=Candidatus Daviesbacteria bacterium RIFCSPHIGHO2_02_FULL_43_12 TaxID=1797776 RepID=A0A1F5KGI6_9BACT|nr:MAG: nucleotide exchange factor GrpE [Candidatus Daviesbacteria bacterium RIFCSPHIGHO2_01_FULL_44_29]OGE39616.1 MAG: nucleotide exchange factor GrpE [Candidatus Daviesbacteria bacterium RIFCSPHIGHO2_12_FULL_47_45]OGE39998.1 MAG: nucleotide exchange factor GrpE [Candidatus Daviesbacteria bacterium RIFCSPHIGHO2_02_FULL_43_12]OGE70321.1 MAG: nucleotide exchange factor GrpE [Candidatus Daviesbacteria bacterium RIFCSPLOWO2_01_FULL_43_15]